MVWKSEIQTPKPVTTPKIIVGIFLGLVTFFLTYSWDVKFYLVVFWTVVLFLLGIGLVRLLGWILSGFFKFD